MEAPMTRNISTATARRIVISTLAALGLAALASAPPATARGYYPSSAITLSPGGWQVDVAQSHFGPDYSTMMIERANASSGDKAGSNIFVVVTDGKVYLATAAEVLADHGAKKI